MTALNKKEYRFGVIQYQFVLDTDLEEPKTELVSWMWAVAISFLVCVVLRVLVYNSLKNIGAPAFLHCIAPCNRN